MCNSQLKNLPKITMGWQDLDKEAVCNSRYRANSYLAELYYYIYLKILEGYTVIEDRILHQTTFAAGEELTLIYLKGLVESNNLVIYRTIDDVINLTESTHNTRAMLIKKILNKYVMLDLGNT